MSGPVVSVVIPTYNRAELLPRAMDSVIHQTFEDWEIVLIDDGSSDATRALAEEYGQRLGTRWVYRRQENRGCSAARNRGIEASRGEFVAFLDSDDAFTPEKLDRQLTLFRRRPELGFVYSDYSQVDDAGESFPSAFDAKFPIARRVPGSRVGPGMFDCGTTVFDHLLRGYFISTIVGMVRREVLGDAIRFSERHSYAEEWLFYLKVARRARAGFVDEPLSIHYATRGSLARADKERNLFSYHDLLGAILAEFDDLSAPQSSAVRRNLADSCRQLAFHLERSGRFREAMRFRGEALRHQPGVKAAIEWVRAAFASVNRRPLPPVQPGRLVVR